MGENQIASAAQPRVTVGCNAGFTIPPRSQIRVHDARVMTVFEENPKALSLPWSVSPPAA